MWNDVETTQDLLNFKVVADTAAQMIKDGNGQPVSTGASGSWDTSMKKADYRETMCKRCLDITVNDDVD